MPTLSRPSRDHTTTRSGFDLVGLTALVRAVTDALLSARIQSIGHRQPSDPSIASLRADIRHGKKEPVKHLLKMNFADLDAGAPVELVNQYLRDMMAANEQYAARKDRRDRAGLLSFREQFTRAHQRETIAQGRADVFSLGVDENSVESIDAALVALNKYDGPQEELKAVLTHRRLELLSDR